jgi:hypothetical protein
MAALFNICSSLFVNFGTILRYITVAIESAVK